MNDPLSRERILSLFHVDLERGKLYWKNVSKYHSSKNGMEAGGIHTTGNRKEYWKVMIDGRIYGRGKLIHAVATGGWAEVIDHINGNSLDDRSINLRAATITQNAWNHKTRARRLKLPMGVRLTPQGRYSARISCEKKHYPLGCFDTPEEDHTVYLQKRRELFGDFSGLEDLCA